MASNFVVYDIETVPDTQFKWEPPEEDPDAFPPHPAHRIVTIGTLTFNQDLQVVSGGVCKPGAASKDEGSILRDFSSRAEGNHIVDFNGRGFDISVIQWRSWHHGVDIQWYFRKPPGKYSKEYRNRYSNQHIDLAEQWSNFRASPYPSLDALSKAMGLPGKDGSLGGGNVLDAWNREDYEAIDRYVMEDVIQTAFIFLRWRWFTDQISLDKYQVSALALVERLRQGTRYHTLLEKMDVNRVLNGMETG